MPASKATARSACLGSNKEACETGGSNVLMETVRPIYHSRALRHVSNLWRTNMADPRPLTRDQLAKFLPDAEAIKRFERLFAVAGDLTPTDVATLYRLTQEASVDANNAGSKAQMAVDTLAQVIQDAAVNFGTADSKATQALDVLSSIAKSLELLVMSPTKREDAFLKGDYIDINTTAPVPVGAVGRLKWNDTDGTLDLGLKGGNVTLQVGQENVLRVKNDEATTLNDGEVVYITGASGANLLVKRALGNSDVTSASTIGVVTESIAANGQGFITTFGQVRGLDTSAFNEGDVLYLSPTIAGAITATKPVAPQHMVLVGYCTKKSAGNGEIFVKVDNGYEIDELHNVLVAAPVQAGSLLIYDATVGVWKNARLTAGTNVSISSVDGSITINSSNPGGTVTDVTGTAPVVSSGGTTPDISMSAASSLVPGYLTSADWNTFNGKQAALVSGTNIKTVGGNSLLGAGDVGTITPGYGGTGITAYTIGDIMYASGATTLSRLADVATGNVLLSGGVTAAPFWGKVGLTTHISGTLGVGNGGTGATSLNGILFGNGGSAFSSVSGSGSASVANAATQTIVGMTGQGRYEVWALIANSGSTANWAAFATVIFDGSGSRFVASNGGALTISVSGTNIVLTNGTGATQTFQYGYLKIGV